MATISDAHDRMIGLNNSGHSAGFSMAGYLTAIKTLMDNDPIMSQKSPVTGDYKTAHVKSAALRVRNQGL